MNAIGTDPQPVFYYNLAALYDSQEDKKNAFQYFNIYRGRAKNEAFKEAEKRYVNKIKRRMGFLKRELGIKAHTKLE